MEWSIAMPTKKQDLLSLTDNPSASQVVAWLNSFSPDPKTPNEGLMMHMGKELFTKIFPDTDWQDALKPYATMKKKGVESRQAKYSSLVYSTNKDEWQKAKEL
jgi:hypothetical protein